MMYKKDFARLVSGAAALGFLGYSACSKTPQINVDVNKDYSNEEALPDMSIKREDILAVVERVAPWHLETISAGYDSLVTPIYSFDDIRDQNDPRFENRVNVFIFPQSDNVFYLRDSNNPKVRKLNMIIYLQKIGETISFNTMNIPNKR